MTGPAATLTATTAALVEDAAWLALTGESWSQAVIRLGYAGKANALERRLHRAGRYDLITALCSHETSPLERDWFKPRRLRTAA